MQVQIGPLTIKLQEKRKKNVGATFIMNGIPPEYMEFKDLHEALDHGRTLLLRRREVN